ncbi:hypothetical protein GCM10023192_21240 [Amycolatopsis samaneae]
MRHSRHQHNPNRYRENPNVASGALNAPNATLGALDAPNVALGVSRCGWDSPNPMP